MNPAGWVMSTNNWNGPDCVGVPLIKPLDDIVNPAGSGVLFLSSVKANGSFGLPPV